MTATDPPGTATGATTRTATTIRILPGPGSYMCGLTWDGTHLWHSDQDARRIYAIDPADGSVVREHPCAWVRADLAHDGARLHQVGGRPKRMVVVDPGDGRVLEHHRVHPESGRLTGAEFGPEGLWMCLRGPTVVQLRDPTAARVLREFPARGSSPSGLTYARGVVVYGDHTDAVLHAMDARTGRHLGTLALDGHPTGLAWDGEHLWYCDFPSRSFRALAPSELLAIRPSEV
jgi:outer membrane protein assembly factor BamB